MTTKKPLSPILKSSNYLFAQNKKSYRNQLKGQKDQKKQKSKPKENY